MRYDLFVGPSYRSQAITADAERCVNWYPEVMESPGAKTKAALYPTPGLSTFVTLVDFPVRGMFQQDHFGGGPTTPALWVVSGGTLYALQSTGLFTTVSLVTASTSPATFTSSGATGNELMALSGGTATLYDLAGETIEGTVALSAQTCGYLSNRFLALDSATGTLKMSDILDGMTWPAGNFVQRSAAGDPWQSMIVAHGEIWLFGAKTGEVWYDAGTSPQPFAMVPNSLFQAGVAAIYSPAVVGSNIMWLGANVDGQAIVWQEQGYTPQRVSNFAVERAIQSYATISDAIGYAYQEQGHTFYVLNFPTAGATWVFDQTTGVWHERGFWDSNQMAYTAQRTLTSAFAFGKHYVGDSVTGAVYQSSVDFTTDAGGFPIRRLRISPVLSDENRRLFHAQLNIDIQPGLGNQTGLGANPSAMLRFSDNGGQTWGNTHTASAGPVGAYDQRIIYRKLGQARNRVYELTVTDPIPWRVVNAYVEAQEGTS